MHILFVDDEPAIRELFSISLRKEYDLHIAEDGLQALQLVKDHHFDLIITDISLPKMNGVEFIKTIRKEGNLTPFIIITGDSNIELAIDTFRMGAIDFFLKPFRIASIKTVIERFYSMHFNKTELLHSKDFIHLEENGVYEILPKISRVNYYVNLLIQKISDLPNLMEEDRLALKVTLYELISNAIEHGTAGINYKEKKEILENNGDYFQAVEERCKNTSKKITIRTIYDPKNIKISIEDEGSGFDPNQVPDPIKNPSANLFSGRGLFLTRLNIDQIDFNERGNNVTITRFLKNNTATE
jgi:DNA-binding response OmpR family regulator